MSDKNPIVPEEKDVVELSQEALDQVTGGDNPFADEPRVPVAPIDPELREDV